MAAEIAPNQITFSDIKDIEKAFNLIDEHKIKYFISDTFFYDYHLRPRYPHL